MRRLPPVVKNANKLIIKTVINFFYVTAHFRISKHARPPVNAPGSNAKISTVRVVGTSAVCNRIENDLELNKKKKN